MERRVAELAASGKLAEKSKKDDLKDIKRIAKSVELEKHLVANERELDHAKVGRRKIVIKFKQIIFIF